MTDPNFRPLPLRRVTLEPGFWGDRVRLVRQEAIPHQWEALNDRVPGAPPSRAVRNLRIAAAEAEGNYEGPVFLDSDLAKWLEAVSHFLCTKRDPELERLADEVIDLFLKAQWDDGYVNSYFTVKDPAARWTNLRDAHELYCAGHWIEAAVAHHAATGRRRFLDAVCRLADHIHGRFGPGNGQTRGYPGHEEIELALVELYRCTGKRRYLELASYFIDERGRQPHYFDIEARRRGEDPTPLAFGAYAPYDEYQAHLPVREQTAVEGHAVRAMYLFSGMADVAAETGDEFLVAACKRLWENMVGRRIYVTGGIGSQCTGERFTFDYDLPNDTAYTETCAAIGLVFWAHRMLHLDLDAAYADMMEKALYNGVLSGLSLDAKAYFYVNPLAVWPEPCEKRADTRHVETRRQPWFACACCPPNLARLLASFGKYVYSESPLGPAVHLYTSSTADLEVAGRATTLRQETDYPWGENVTIVVEPEEAALFTVFLRIPGWCRNPRLAVNGEELPLSAILRQGYARVDRLWRPHDRIELTLPMPIERIRAHPEVRENAGKVALQRGPVVYCLEEADNGRNLPALSLPANAPLSARFRPDFLGGVMVISGEAHRNTASGWNGVLYQAIESSVETAPLTMIPYFAWANRQPGEMLVWIRDEKG